MLVLYNQLLYIMIYLRNEAPIKTVKLNLKMITQTICSCFSKSSTESLYNYGTTDIRRLLVTECQQLFLTYWGYILYMRTAERDNYGLIVRQYLKARRKATSVMVKSFRFMCPLGYVIYYKYFEMVQIASNNKDYTCINSGVFVTFLLCHNQLTIKSVYIEQII